MGIGATVGGFFSSVRDNVCCGRGGGSARVLSGVFPDVSCGVSCEDVLGGASVVAGVGSGSVLSCYFAFDLWPAREIGLLWFAPVLSFLSSFPGSVSC